MKQPKPKTVKVECDVCGLDWNQHKPDAKGKVGLDECVRLLRIEVTRVRSYPNTTSSVRSPIPIWFNTTGSAA